MTDEDILNALQDINNILDGYLERVAVLKFNNPQKPEYYEQLLKAIKKVDRCVGGTVLPVEGGCCTDPEIPTISCEGATDFIDFSSIAGLWGFYLDGVLLGGMEWSDAQGLINALGFAYPGKFNGDFDGYFWMQNTDEQPHRFKFVPLHNVEFPNSFVVTGDNPTFIEHEDGSLTFCLAASTTEPV